MSWRRWKMEELSAPAPAAGEELPRDDTVSRKTCSPHWGPSSHNSRTRGGNNWSWQHRPARTSKHVCVPQSDAVQNCIQLDAIEWTCSLTSGDLNLELCNSLQYSEIHVTSATRRCDQRTVQLRMWVRLSARWRAGFLSHLLKQACHHQHNAY